MINYIVVIKLLGYVDRENFFYGKIVLGIVGLFYG